MYYVYFLKSKRTSFRYVGYTENIERRLKEHNEGRSKSTKPYIPFILDGYIAVTEMHTAKNLEKYFKTGSGIAFSRKRILSKESSKAYEALAK